MMVILFAMVAGAIPQETISPQSWMVLSSFTVILAICLFAIMLPGAYINKQTQYQMRRLIYLRENYWRIITDSRILRANPKTLDTRLARVAIYLLRNQT